MSFLPIVERELRVAARKRRTYWSRVTAAVAALFMVLVTPIRAAQIVQGHWWALRRLFLFPTMTLVGLRAATHALQIAMFIDLTTKSTPPGNSITYNFLTEQVTS